MLPGLACEQVAGRCCCPGPQSCACTHLPPPECSYRDPAAVSHLGNCDTLGQQEQLHSHQTCHSLQHRQHTGQQSACNQLQALKHAFVLPVPPTDSQPTYTQPPGIHSSPILLPLINTTAVPNVNCSLLYMCSWLSARRSSMRRPLQQVSMLFVADQDFMTHPSSHWQSGGVPARS